MNVYAAHAASPKTLIMQMFTFDQGTIQAEARNWRARRSSSSATSARCVAVPCRRLNSASTTWRTHFRTDPHQQAQPRTDQHGYHVPFNPWGGVRVPDGP